MLIAELNKLRLIALLAVGLLVPWFGLNNADAQASDPVVSITSVSGGNRVELTEGEELYVTLWLNVSPTATQALTVKLRTEDIGALTDSFSSVTLADISIDVTVSANDAVHPFVVSVVNDRIAAEPIRTANIVVEAGDGYIVSDTANTVEIAVEDDDVATVSISPVRDRVTEGDTIVFKVTQDLATDQATSINLALTHNGDFFSMDTLNFGNREGINLKLTNRNQRNGKVYYYLDRNGNSNPDDLDRITHTLLDNLLNNGDHTVNTQSDGHDGSDDARSVIIDNYALVLPTVTEIQAFLAAGIPDGWSDSGFYWAAGFGSHFDPVRHEGVHIATNSGVAGVENANYSVFFQVLTSRRVISVNLPAGQPPMGTVMVEVATIDMDDPITDRSLVATLVGTSHPALKIGDPSSAEVVINALIPLSIEATPGTFDLTEGESTQLSVSVSRIEGSEVTINVEAPEGLSVSASELTFSSSSPDPKVITVTAVEDDRYTGDRSETLTLTADDYPMATVTVDITEDDLLPIGLIVEPTELNLVRFTNTMIEVSADVDAILNVETEGAVRLTEGRTSDNLALRAEEVTQIQIEAVGEGDGTVSFRVSRDGKKPKTAVVSVTVTRPTLVISEVSALAIDLAARTAEELAVRVNAEAGVPNDVILTATVIDTKDVVYRWTTWGWWGRWTETVTTGTENVRVSRHDFSVGTENVSVSPMERTDVSVDTPTSFIVNGLDAGEAMLRLTASHPDYESASTEVAVSVYLPPVGLIVSTTALEVVVGMSETFTVTATASTLTWIWATSGNSEIASMEKITLAVNSSQLSGQTYEENGLVDRPLPIEVHGVNIGMTTVTIEAVADGHAETATVMVEVVDTLRIETDSDRLSLVEGGDGTQLSVGVNRIEGSEVTINIEAPPGLSVSASELTFSSSSPDPKVITVTAVEDDRYTGDRSETLTLTADDYTMATVTVDITEDDLLPIGLIVEPTELDLVRFTNTMIEVSADVDAILNVETEGAVRLTEGRTSDNLALRAEEVTQIQIEALGEGNGTVSFRVSRDGKKPKTAVVSVTVKRPALVISEVSALAIDLAARATEELAVRVNAEAGVPNDVILTATVIGATDVAAVSPSEITDVPADTLATFTVSGLDAGNTRIRLTASHPDYESASTEVAVSVYLPPLEVVVSPTVLEVVVGTKELFTVAVRDNTFTSVWVRSGNSEIASLPLEGYRGPSGFVGWSVGFMGGQYGPRVYPWQGTDGEYSVAYYVVGVNIGMTTVTVTAEADGYAAGTATVMVEVVDTLRIEADSDMLSLEEGDNTQVSVSVNRIEG